MIPIPDRMKHLKVDPRGYPIPHGVVIDRDGKAHFAIADEIVRQRSIRQGLCGICGTKLFRGRWLIGGPLSAFASNGAFLDPPMHDECAHFALHTCPYLAVPRYAREIGAAKAKASDLQQDFVMNVAAEAEVGRPSGDLFVALMTVDRIDLVMDGQYVKPRGEYRKIEFWRHGNRLSDAEGLGIIAEHYPEIIDAIELMTRDRHRREE
jgi:hypothetical protein